MKVRLIEATAAFVSVVADPGLKVQTVNTLLFILKVIMKFIHSTFQNKHVQKSLCQKSVLFSFIVD